MKITNFKFNKRQALLFGSLIALTGFGIWSSGILSSEASKAPVDSSEHVTERVSEASDSVDKQIPTKITESSVSAVQEPKENPTQPVVNETPLEPTVNPIVSKFSQCYPTYYSANRDLFVSNIETIISTVGEDKIERFLDNHTRTTGLVCGESSKDREKNSFFRLVVNSSYNFGLSWAPWSTL